MTRPSRLDDPRYAEFAWSRYWRLMRLMLAVTIVTTIVVLASFWWRNGLVSIHFYIATAGGIIFSMLLMSALMGLVFLSSGSGHDEVIEDPFEEQSQ